MSRDGEKVIELASELASRMGHLLSDVVPPSAQVHLLNAQRELITALVLIYENRVSPPARGRPAARRPSARTRTAKRAAKIPID